MSRIAPESLLRTYLLAFLSTLTFASLSTAQTYVEGPVSGIWTPDGNPYVATDTLVVLEGESLLIEPGVEVCFDGRYPLIVYGRLSAEGTVDDSIRFEPFGQTPWRGIRFFAADDASCLLYCSIRDSEVDGETVQTGSGGGIYSEYSSPIIADCTIRNCEAVDLGGGLNSGGGGIYCLGGSPQIIGNRILDCGANVFCLDGGGGIYFRQADVLIQENEILRCRAHGLGGGIAGSESQIDVSHNVIAECLGFHYGGGLYLTECTGTLFDNLIVGNQSPDVCAGGILLGDCDVEVAFCTIAHNIAGVGEDWGFGGGICVVGPPYAVIRDCIIWGNTAWEDPQIYPQTLESVFYCDVQGGYSGEGNFDADPLFASCIGGGRHTGYFLSAVAAGQGADSPCIDAGDRSAADAMLDMRTTRTDLIPDSGIADLGYHHDLTGTIDVADAIRPRDMRIFITPNPFRDHTTIRFHSAVRSDDPLDVVDLSGRLVRVLDPQQYGGILQFTWDGRNEGGRRVTPGVYFLRIRSGKATRSTGKLIVCR